MKSGNINFLEHSGPFQACNGTALPLPLPSPLPLSLPLPLPLYFTFILCKSSNGCQKQMNVMKYMRV